MITLCRASAPPEAAAAACSHAAHSPAHRLSARLQQCTRAHSGHRNSKHRKPSRYHRGIARPTSSAAGFGFFAVLGGSDGSPGGDGRFAAASVAPAGAAADGLAAAAAAGFGEAAPPPPAGAVGGAAAAAAASAAAASAAGSSVFRYQSSVLAPCVRARARACGRRISRLQGDALRCDGPRRENVATASVWTAHGLWPAPAVYCAVAIYGGARGERAASARRSQSRKCA